MPEVSGIKQEAFEGLKKALLSLKVRILCKPFRHWIVEVREISIDFSRLNITAFFCTYAVCRCFSGVMVSVLASSAVDRRFDDFTVNAPTYCIYCEIIVNRGVLIFVDFVVHSNHEN